MKTVETVFTEIGLGNDTFINTEFEYSDGSEDRRAGFVKMKVNDFYLRLWLGTNTYILSFKDGFIKKPKNRKEFKLLIGFAGELN